MKYTKKPKYKLAPSKTFVKKEKEPTAEEIYKEALKGRARRRR